MSMAITGAGGSGGAMAVSGASGRMPPQQKMSALFNTIDTSGSGSITQSQFDQAFQTMNPPAGIKAQGANAIWAQLDPSGSGSVSKADFVSTMKTVLANARNGANQSQGATASSGGTLSAAGQTLGALGTPNGGVNLLV
ncbi:MAG: EF-hand domain-containing protein [Magnetospirillum sp.]|nr:EF-hand domain-containing protein [Magnetospirillum sp.]